MALCDNWCFLKTRNDKTGTSFESRGDMSVDSFRLEFGFFNHDDVWHLNSRS